MRLKSIVLTICLCLQPSAVFCQPDAAPQSNYDFSGVAERIQQAIATKEIPSMAVAVSQNGRIVYEAAFGYADIEQKIPATVSTAYRLASVSKPITATGLMVLYQKGLVNLDAPAEQYARPLRFKSFAGSSSDVTLRHLLTHSSGLSSYFQYAFDDARQTAPDFETAFREYGAFFYPAKI